jgi:chromatin segregation and condensation protein Rec8/ScpA/Scc1 (kleisin family)
MCALTLIRLPALLARARTPSAEGLLHRLRELVERGLVPFGDVRLAGLTGWLLTLVQRRDPYSIDDLCAVLEAVARLALLKARRLSGWGEPGAEEDEAPWPGPPPELPARRSWLAERIGGGPWSFSGAARSYEEGTAALVCVEPDGLRMALEIVLGRQRPRLQLVPGPAPRASVDHCTGLILHELARRGQLALEEIAGPSRDGHVAAFLACLILARQGRISLVQEQPFGEIHIRPATAALEATA